MKPVFKCEYCDFMGTEEEVLKHEKDCIDNDDRRSCLTCKHRSFQSMNQFKCAVGKEIPEGHEITFCGKYERKEKSKYGNLNDIFGSFFGGF